jgi:hypothetical protein
MDIKHTERHGRNLSAIALGSAPALVLAYAAVGGEEDSSILMVELLTLAVVVGLAGLAWFGYSWARWLLSIALLAFGSLSGLAGLFELLRNPNPMSLGWVIYAGLLVTAASVLAFSESVREFLSGQAQSDAARAWDQFATIGRARVVHDWSDQSTLMDAARKREALGRVSTGVMATGLCLALLGAMFFVFEVARATGVVGIRGISSCKSFRTVRRRS